MRKNSCITALTIDPAAHPPFPPFSTLAAPTPSWPPPGRNAPAPAGAATRIEMRTVFPTKELRDEAVEKYHAIEGGQQTLSNLAAYVTEIVWKGVED